LQSLYQVEGRVGLDDVVHESRTHVDDGHLVVVCSEDKIITVLLAWRVNNNKKLNW